MTLRAVRGITSGMLDELAERPGGTPPAPLFLFTRAGGSHERRGSSQMTIKFSTGEGQTVDLLAVSEAQLRESAELLALTIQDLRAGKFGEVKTAQAAVRDLKQTFQMVMDERTRVDKLRKQVDGVVRGHTLDFEAARDEIGRRLACLRDAGGS